MKLIFPGTRGYIEARTKLHAMHSTLAVEYRGKRAIIDCGEDWLGRVEELEAKAIFITHGHPDHAWGLRDGAPCPVHATEETWASMVGFGIRDREVIVPRKPVKFCGMSFEAFKVEHSTRAPAVGYRVTAGRAALFYVPDVVYIPERKEAFSGINVYIGDGATITRSMVRKSNGTLIGHTPVSTQLTWCRKEGVPRAVFTHCGSEIVNGEEDEVEARIRTLASERGVEAGVAHDGMTLVLG